MNKKHFGIIIGAILFLAVAMGIGRFSFTPMLPFLREAENLSVSTGAWIATGNYIGYLIGALGAGWIVKNQKGVLVFNTVLCMLSILFMGFTTSIAIWFSLRIISGITGGIIFVLTSSILMDYLASKNLGKWSGYTFSGIGLGIVIAGLTVPLFIYLFNWKVTYIALAVIASLFIITTLILWRNLHGSDQKVNQKRQKVMRGFMIWLTIAYGLEGMGYIITGTFLVDIIHDIPLLRPYAGFSWVAVGLGAMPSAPLWIWLMATYKKTKVITIAYLLQIFGMLLPVLYTNIYTVLIAALLFGSTFVGLVAMTTGFGRQLYPSQSASVVSLLTSFYAFGQIIGPFTATYFVAIFKSYNAAMVVAAVIVTSALLVLRIGVFIEKRKEHKNLMASSS